MIRKLLATTAIATLIASGAYAQTADPMAPAPAEQAQPNVVQAEGHLASNIIGESVYNGMGEEAENIGDVNDLVMNDDGSLEAVVVGVGGFLGLGQKNVAIEFNAFEWTEIDGDRYLVLQTTREQLEALPEFDTAAFEPQPADREVGNTQPAGAQDVGAAGGAAATTDMSAAPADDAATDDMAAAPADGDDVATAPVDEAAPTAEPAPTDGMAAAPADATDGTQTSAIDRNSLTDVDQAAISADELIGTTVYGANDENVGDIDDVVLSQDGEVEAVIVEVGGFLGMGSKHVAVSMDNLAFMSDGDSNMYLYTQFTQEQLEAQPEYDETTYAEQRDDQLLVSPVQ